MSIAESEERETGRTVQAMRKRNGRCRKARAVPPRLHDSAWLV
jgi:hypothetical protein